MAWRPLPSLRWSRIASRPVYAPSRRRTCRRWPRRPTRRAVAWPRSTARCARRSSATATGSCTPSRSGGSSTRRRCSSRPRATTTAPGSRTRSRPRRSRARWRGRCGSTRTWWRRSGSGTTSGTRRSATSARTCSTRCLRERFGRGFRHNEHSLRVVDVLEGLNVTEPVRDGILRHSGGAERPATLEGKIVRLVDRIAYINHDIDDALRAGVLEPADLPAEEIAVLGATGSARIDTLVHDLVEHSEAAGDIVQGERVGGAMLRAALVHVRARVPRRRSARAEHAKIERVLRGLFDWYCEHPEELPPATAGAIRGRARDRLPRRDDRPLRDPRLDRALRAAGPRRSDGPLHATSPGSGSATRSTSRSSSARARSCKRAGRAAGCRACARSTRSGRRRSAIDPVEKLYHCFGCGAGGDVFTFVDGDRGAGLRRRAGVAGRALRGRARARDRGPARRPRGASGATGCSRCWSAPPRTTCACCGSRPRRRPRASTWSRAGWRRATLREFRVGFAPGAWDRVLNGLAAGRLPRRGAARGRAGLALAPRRPASTTASAARITFPLADERGRVLGLRRAGAAPRASGRST